MDSSCNRQTCRLSGEKIPPLSKADDRCGNCDHHSELHQADGCTVQIQPKSGNKNIKCPCEWNAYQASSLERADG